MNPYRRYRYAEKEIFGDVDGKAVVRYVLANSRGTTVKVMTYGAAITAIETADRSGRIEDVVLGFDNFSDYLSPKQPYFGAVVGRVANRTARGQFTLNGSTYQLTRNDGEHHLHGGSRGFDKVVWSVREAESDRGCAVVFSHLSQHGEEGYPGNCNVETAYTLSDDDSLCIDYTVTTDQDTPINITNHSYFNLAGPATHHILNHELMLHADHYTPVDATRIPTGQMLPVAGTPFDFRQLTRIGARLSEVGGTPVGYDHNYVLTDGRRGLTAVATVYEPTSGRLLEVSSTEPGVQFYSGNFLDGTVVGKNGVPCGQHAALCLETQHFPDSIHHPSFPSTVLKAGDYYRSTTVFRFAAS